jgi:AcrR family transcriptional regulator
MSTQVHAKKVLIKKAAKQLFFHFGLSKTSMEDIARQCKLAKPSIYYYYPNKESIFEEIVVEEASNFISKVSAKIPSDFSAKDKIFFFYKTYFSDLKKYAKKLEHLPETLYENYPHGRPITDKITTFLRANLEPLINQGIQDGSLSVNDQRQTVAAITMMTDFLNIDWILHNDEKEVDRVFDRVIEIILNGIRRNNSNEN